MSSCSYVYKTTPSLQVVTSLMFPYSYKTVLQYLILTDSGLLHEWEKFPTVGGFGMRDPTKQFQIVVREQMAEVN